MSAEMDFVSLVSGKNLILAGGAFALTNTLRMSFKEFFKTRLGERLLPVIPVLFSMIGALAGICEKATTVGDKLVLGMIVGFAAGHIFKMGKTSVLGIGIPEKKTPEELAEDMTDQVKTEPDTKTDSANTNK